MHLTGLASDRSYFNVISSVIRVYDACGTYAAGSLDRILENFDRALKIGLLKRLSDPFDLICSHGFVVIVFVDDIVSIGNNLWEVSCVMDVLATYKADIEEVEKLIEKKNRVTKLYSMNTRCWLEKCHSDKMFLQ